MKQTVEEVAREAAEDCYECHYDDSLEMRLVKEAFRQGAEWQSKQSLWISVKEKAGCDTSDDCIVMVANGDKWILCPEIKFSTYWVYNDVDVNLDVIHKATVNELIEHFKIKEE